MTAFAVIAHAGKAGGKDLRDQRDALRDVLVLAEQQHQQRHQHAPGGHAQKAGEYASGETGHQPAENIR